MKRKTLENMIYILLIYLIACAVMYLLQRKLLYYPTGKIQHSFPQLKLINQNESIEVIVLNEGKNDALLYFGGNAESVIYNAEDFLASFPIHTVYLLIIAGMDKAQVILQKRRFFQILFCFSTRFRRNIKISL